MTRQRTDTLRRIWLLCAPLLFVTGLQVVIAQDSTWVKGPLMFSGGATMNYGLVLAHSEKVKSTSNANPVGFTASLHWQRADRSDFDLYRCLPRHSLQIAYYNMGNEALGKGTYVSYALQPYFMVNRSFSFYPKFAAGVGFLTNPHDSINNPSNKAYSLPVNVYLSLGVGLRYQITKHWAVKIESEFQHVSNGGLYKPNVGVNFPSLGAGIEFSPVGLELKKHEIRGSIEKPHSRRMDVQIFGVMKYGDFSGSGDYYPIAGLNFTHSWQVSRIHAWTAAMEVYQDHYLKEHNNSGGVDTNPTRVGVLAGHEFLLGKFIFSQQIGLYLTESYRQDMMYHRWGLQYAFHPKWSVGFNMLVHRATADFADIRLAYSIFGKQRE